MSFKIIRLFRQPSFLRQTTVDSKISNRVCIHCSASHCADDKTSKDVVLPEPSPRYIEKEEMIGSAMKSYLLRKQKSDALMEKSVAEYNLGKRHLANILGVDEEELTKDRIREAIEYLLPSGLHNKKARPMMEHPLDLAPEIKGANFDMTGRPNHCFFYTAKPGYYELMHKLAWSLEHVRSDYAEKSSDRQMAVKRHNALLNQLKTSDWISLSKFQAMFLGEKLSEHEYRRLVLLLERILEQPFSYKEKDFLLQFREMLERAGVTEKSNEVLVDESGRQYVITKGGRKRANATVTLTSRGTGSVNINGRDITFFKDVMHRETALSPLQLCEVLDKFDLDITVDETGASAQAGAIRLGIARALVSFVPEEQAEKLRLAGFLTRDPRMRERKKPGQEKARKKFTWKRR